jgi:hypothetical protein
MQEAFIVHDFKLPDHTNDLSKANDVIERLKKKIEELKFNNVLDDKNFIVKYEEIIRVLAFVGNLSVPAFEIQEELEALYTKQYIHSPELGKKLWLDHYENVHHPYSLLKNRCYKLLDELDALYRNKYKKDPPNWNY